MKISEVAKLLDLPISTIRYYEKMGVLPDDLILRDKNKYRVYTLDSINYLRVLKAVLDAGFSISEVKNMISINGIS
ncbi:MarR family transcriptional regulator, partial [Terribacillus saccharophilus]